MAAHGPLDTGKWGVVDKHDDEEGGSDAGVGRPLVNGPGVAAARVGKQPDLSLAAEPDLGVVQQHDYSREQRLVCRRGCPGRQDSTGRHK